MDTNSDNSKSCQTDRPTSRRQLLGIVGTAGFAATTGCLAWTNDIEPTTSPDTPTKTAQPPSETPSRSGETTVATLCNQIAAQFIPYNASTTDLVCNCEVPAALAEYLGTRVESYEHRAFRPVEVTTTGGLALNLIQSMGSAIAESPHAFTDTRPQEFTIEFNDETVPLYGQTEANSPSRDTIATTRLDTSLPYMVEGSRLYFPVMIQLSLQAGEAIPDRCRDIVTTAAHRIAQSLQVNPQSTVAESV